MSSPQVDRDAIRSLLAMVRGVESVEVTSSNGSVESIEVAIGARESRGRIVRDVESALVSGLGVEIDHEKIHVVHLVGSDAERGTLAERASERSASGDETGPTSYAARLRLVDVRVEESGDALHCAVIVTVESDGNPATGRMRDADTPRGRILSAARAALLAVEETITDRTAFLLEGIEEFELADQAALIALVQARQERTSRTLLGCALVDAHPSEAAARAALDAVNRFWDAQTRVPASDS